MLSFLLRTRFFFTVLNFFEVVDFLDSQACFVANAKTSIFKLYIRKRRGGFMIPGPMGKGFQNIRAFQRFITLLGPCFTSSKLRKRVPPM